MMSNIQQSIEELDAVLHWRGKHAQAIRERDALQQRLTAADERADVLEGLVHRTLEYFTEPGMPEDLLSEFRAALARVATTCTWQYGAFSWHTGCGQEWMLNDGTPEQNGMRFCHSCGKTLVVHEDQPESERES
jgi:hypothetical protein